MTGKYTIEIDAKDFVKGMSTTNDIADGGFSSSTDAVNPTHKVGTLYQPNTATDRSTNLTGNIIASCEDPNDISATQYNRLFLDDDGAFYSYNGTALTKEVTASGDLFTRGTTDFVAWNDYTSGGSISPNFYATTKAGAGGDVVKWNRSTGLTETWWSGAGTLNQGALSAYTSWRPLLVYETYLYVGDKHKLHRISPDSPATSSSVSNGILVLGLDENISALGIDKGSGYMLIATTNGSDYSSGRNGSSKIYLYDGFSNKALRVIPINGLVTSFKQVDDRTLVFYGNKVGYFTGSGVQFLRKLNFSIGDANTLIYPHRAMVIENTCYIAEDKKIIAYGEILPGNKVFYPVYVNSPSGTPTRIDMLAHVGGEGVGFGYATDKFYTVNVHTASTAGTSDVYFNKINFPRPVFIRSAYIEWTDAVSNGVTPGSLRIVEAGGTETLFSSLQNTTGSDAYSIETKSMDRKVQTAQVRYVASTATTGLKRIVIYYDIAE